MSGYDAKDIRAYQESGSTLDLDEWLEKRRGNAALKPGVIGTPPRRPSIPSKRCTVDGHRFDSKLEGRRYQWLQAQPEVVHIDVHPVFTLSTGRRYRADFLVWERAPGLVERFPLAEEVKGFARGEAWRRFQLIREDFDKHHPLAPLRVVTFDRKAKAWREV